MNSTDAMLAAFRNDRELFLDKLSSYILVDIGIINNVDADGRAVVTSSSFIGGKPVVYEEAEVIFPGNAYGSYASTCSGCTCLIFIPRSCMPDVNNQKLRIGATPYHRDGVKALPIGNGSNNIVKTCFNSDGSYELSSKVYSAQFTEDGITIQRNDGTTSISVDGTGQLYLTRQTDNGVLNINIEDEVITKSWVSEDGKVRWLDTINTDGSIELVQDNPQDEEGDPFCSIAIDKTGEATITMAKKVTFETKDELVLKGKTVDIQAEEEFTMTGKSVDVSSTDGDVSLTAVKDTEGDGKVVITSDDNTEITAGNKATIDSTDNTEITAGAKLTADSTNGTDITSDQKVQVTTGTGSSMFTVNGSNLEVDKLA